MIVIVDPRTVVTPEFRANSRAKAKDKVNFPQPVPLPPPIGDGEQ